MINFKCRYCKENEPDYEICVKNKRCVMNCKDCVKYFCSGLCATRYINEQCCRLCHCSAPSTELEKMDNGFFICKNDYFHYNGYFPSCKERYTGSYFCNICNNYQNVCFDECYAIRKSDLSICGIDIECHVDKIFVYCCEMCVGKFETMNSEYEYGFKIVCRLDKNFDNIIKKIKNKKLNKFMCNGCENIISDKNPHISNNKNLCDRCFRNKNSYVI